MRPFSIFVIFYMTAVLLEMVEKWEHPVFAGVFFVLSAVLVFTKITRIKFLFFLVLTTAYFVGFRFPEVPNHVNLIILLNTFLIAGMTYSLINRSRFPGDDDYFDMMLPYLRATLIPVYFLAGFHKLNGDFLDPEVSCATGTLHSIKNMLQSDFWGFPKFMVMGLGLGLVIGK